MESPKQNISKMNRILIIGAGSIGQRHIKALINIGERKIAIFRTGKGTKSLDIDIEKRSVIFTDEEEAFIWNPTHLIISNPTSLHWHYVQKAIDKKIKFFVEKPIADNLGDIPLVDKLSQINGVVGYNLRFHGLFKYIKGLIDNDVYGRVISAYLHVGQYLPNWHPYEDYRNAYYARKSLGGGALRTLSHELDLAQYFFGRVKSLFAKVQKVSDLEIDVDDLTSIIAKTEGCEQVSIQINLLDPIITRVGRIYFGKGVVEYDLIKSIVTFTANNGNKLNE